MKRVCVYCGSSAGSQPEYIEAARNLAGEMTNREIELVYGGGAVGLMGEIADSVLSLGGKVTGVIPKALVEKEVSHGNLTDLKVVSSMHERKAAMMELSDGFIALPGGLGTVEELFEVLTWSQLGFHQKPCAVLNTKNFYNDLILFLDRTVEDRFVKSVHRNMLIVREDAGDLIDSMLSFKAPSVDKWIG